MPSTGKVSRRRTASVKASAGSRTKANAARSPSRDAGAYDGETDEDGVPIVKTIIDLARVAKVSTGTVSRALSGSPLVKAKTRDHVLALAAKHDFRINVTARNLRTQRTGAIGVVIPMGHDTDQHISDPFFMALIGHIADELTERGYALLLSRVIPASEDWLQHTIQSGRTDGLIIIGQSDQMAVLDRVAAQYRPMVVWGGYAASQVHCSVGTDNHAGGAMAARYLIEQGARRLLFLGDELAPEVAQRLAGARSAVNASGKGVTLDIVPAHFESESAHSIIREQLAKHNAPDGMIAASDVIAMSALRALSESGLRVPDDVRVVGYDDLSLAAQTTPPLTTIRQDLAAGGKHLVDLLMRRIGDTDTDSVILPPKLIVRGSA